MSAIRNAGLPLFLFALAGIAVMAGIAFLAREFRMSAATLGFLAILAIPPLVLMALFLVANLEVDVGGGAQAGSDLDVLLRHKRDGDLQAEPRPSWERPMPFGAGFHKAATMLDVPEGEVLDRLLQWKHGRRVGR